jgi:hypothetical protein
MDPLSSVYTSQIVMLNSKLFMLENHSVQIQQELNHALTQNHELSNSLAYLQSQINHQNQIIHQKNKELEKYALETQNLEAKYKISQEEINLHRKKDEVIQGENKELNTKLNKLKEQYTVLNNSTGKRKNQVMIRDKIIEKCLDQLRSMKKELANMKREIKENIKENESSEKNIKSFQKFTNDMQRIQNKMKQNGSSVDKLKRVTLERDQWKKKFEILHSDYESKKHIIESIESPERMSKEKLKLFKDTIFANIKNIAFQNFSKQQHCNEETKENGDGDDDKQEKFWKRGYNDLLIGFATLCDYIIESDNTYTIMIQNNIQNIVSSSPPLPPPPSYDKSTSHNSEEHQELLKIHCDVSCDQCSSLMEENRQLKMNYHSISCDLTRIMNNCQMISSNTLNIIRNFNVGFVYLLKHILRTYSSDKQEFKFFYDLICSCSEKINTTIQPKKMIFSLESFISSTLTVIQYHIQSHNEKTTTF